MTRILSLALALGLLAACGVDGPPVRPEPEPATGVRPTIAIGGTATIGVSGGSARR